MARALPALLAALALALAGCPKEEDCPSGETRCSGVCKDTRTDPFACGGCTITCAQGASCVDGECQCPAGEVPCGARCVNLQTDAQHCGACDHRCTAAGADPPLGTCDAGSCTCQNGGTSCPALEPECRDLDADPGACGACDVTCDLAGDVCEGGGCTCPDETPTACVAQGVCTDLTSDPANCGACGDPCELANAVCVTSACECPASRPDACPTACVDLDSDEANCGTCGAVCPTGATCTPASGGNPTECRCPAGRIACGPAPGACIDPDTDEDHCGDCNQPCPGSEVCKSGICCGASQVTCGPAGDKTCCDGTACCAGGTCQVAHLNGLPGPAGTFHDCFPAGEFTQAAAQRAASSWSATGTLYLFPAISCSLSQFCLGWQTATACGVWCWGVSDADPLQGRMNLNTASSACVCPGLSSPVWN